jgi:hypothetical protein
LRSKEMQPNVSNDLIVPPHPSTRAPKMIFKRDP